MKVELFAHTKPVDTSITDPLALEKFNAAICYQPSLDKASLKSSGIPIDNLFKMGHHTPFESKNHVFLLEDVPVSLVTMCLHEHPFYNSLQRSFRYTQLDDPSNILEKAERILERYTTAGHHIHTIIEFINRGLDFYNNNICELESIALEALKKERPNFSGNMEIQAARIAQEQGRCVLSTIMPTGMSYTIDTIALMSLYQASWNDPMSALLKMMMIAAGQEDSLRFEIPTEDRYYKPMYHDYTAHMMDKASVRRSNPGLGTTMASNKTWLMKYMDLLQFSPHSKPDGNVNIQSEIVMSAMAYGQFQRHRLMTRDNPGITSAFMLPPLVKANNKWREFCTKYNENLRVLMLEIGTEIMQFVIPYGSCLKVNTSTTMNSLQHFCRKRCCIRAQREIWQIARDLRSSTYQYTALGAPCETDYSGCNEGKMYCGRDLDKPISRNLL